MRDELMALLNAKMQNGEDGYDLVTGCAVALREFVIENLNGGDHPDARAKGELYSIDEELERVANIIKTGVIT